MGESRVWTRQARAEVEKKARETISEWEELTTPAAYFFAIIDEATKEVPRRPIPKIPLEGKQGTLNCSLSSIEAVEE